MRCLIAAFVALFSLAAAQAQSPVLPGPGLTVASSGFSITFKQGASSTTKTATISYGTLTYGAGCGALFIPIQWYNTGSGDTVTGVSVGGSAASQVGAGALRTTQASGQVTTDGWQLNAPTGTSATISVTYSAAPSFDSSIAVYCLVSGTLTATATVSAHGTSPVSQAVTVPTGGTAVVFGASQSGAANSFTNATAEAGTPIVSGGGGNFAYGHTTSTGSVSVTITSSGNVTLAEAAWGP